MASQWWTLLALFILGGCGGASKAGGSAEDRRGDARQATVLFVCEHGNVKSLMAASYFNQIARERGLHAHAVARGTAPDSDSVPPVIADGLRGDGLDTSGF